MQYFILFLPIICTYREHPFLYLTSADYELITIKIPLQILKENFLTFHPLIVMVNIIVNFIK